MRDRAVFVGLAAVLVAAGLSLRLVPWGLPLAIHHYGGGLLWGAMVYALVAALRPPGIRGTGCFLATATIAGQLLLGRIFAPMNIVVDLIGAATIGAATAPRLR